ncbi:UDP-glucose 4-epimerase [Streptococcus constellatus]|uniref:UDP-glucose 4-epimerase n=1 Tax=Streptococcus constellatus TaxID=76860 RepID=A0A564SNB2_STRCV|nr:UDP-glucose 4-epimerase [Streptococcus constellatus]VUX06394.1 UDP-glucose 4-epimerase [Streptococcus gordonii]
MTGYPIPSEIADCLGVPDTKLIDSSDKARQVLDLQPKFDNMEMIIETAWKQHSTHLNG